MPKPHSRAVLIFPPPMPYIAAAVWPLVLIMWCLPLSAATSDSSQEYPGLFEGEDACAIEFIQAERAEAYYQEGLLHGVDLGDLDEYRLRRSRKDYLRRGLDDAAANLQLSTLLGDAFQRVTALPAPGDKPLIPETDVSRLLGAATASIPTPPNGLVISLLKARLPRNAQAYAQLETIAFANFLLAAIRYQAYSPIPDLLHEGAPIPVPLPAMLQRMRTEAQVTVEGGMSAYADTPARKAYVRGFYQALMATGIPSRATEQQAQVILQVERVPAPVKKAILQQLAFDRLFRSRLTYSYRTIVATLYDYLDLNNRPLDE